MLITYADILAFPHSVKHKIFYSFCRKKFFPFYNFTKIRVKESDYENIYCFHIKVKYIK